MKNHMHCILDGDFFAEHKGSTSPLRGNDIYFTGGGKENGRLAENNHLRLF